LEREYEDAGRDTQHETGGQLLLTQPFVPTFASSIATTLSTTLSILSNVESHSHDIPFPRYTSEFSDINIANDSRETEDIQGGGQSNAELLAWYNSAAIPIYDTLSSPEQQPSGLKMVISRSSLVNWEYRLSSLSALHALRTQQTSTRSWDIHATPYRISLARQGVVSILSHGLNR
jgi:hypothetical protein